MPYKDKKYIRAVSKRFHEKHKKRRNLEKRNRVNDLYKNDVNYRKKERDRANLRAQKLGDAYVIWHLKRNLGLTREQILKIPEIIEVHRAYILLQREIKKLTP